MKTIFLFFVTAFAVTTCSAKDIKYPDTYNYNRGIEAYNAENYEEAIDYFNKELVDNPKNGYAFVWLSTITNLSGNNGKALTYVNKGIKLIPKKDKVYLTYAYNLRSKIYLELNDTIKAMNDLTSAIEIDPEYTRTYQNRGNLYYEMGKYDKSDTDYKMLIKLDEASYMGYMGLGRNANMRKDYQSAIDQFGHVMKFYPDDHQAYGFRAESYLGLKKYNEAVDDLIKALEQRNDKAFYITCYELDEAAVPLMKEKLKVKSLQEPSNAYWPCMLGCILESNKQYAEAIQYYLKANELDSYSYFLERAADCYCSLGNYTQAIKLIGDAQNINPSDPDLIMAMADAYGEAGMLKECLAEWQHYIDLYPDYFYPYYRKGFYEDNYNMTDQAIEDYSMSILLDPSYAYAYLGRGDMYLRQGKDDLAKADYEKVTKLDSIPNNSSCAMYAYLALNREDEAIDFMENVIKQDSLDAGNYYDGACFYSRLGDKKKAITMMKKSLELGFARFTHIEHDDDLDPIRDTEGFKELIETYRHKFEEANEMEGIYEEEVVEVPFTKENGVTKVKCQINGLPLHFVFDTGASDVTLSLVEANFMMKNDFISKDDVVGSALYSDANGDIMEGTVINLKSVNFGGLELTNVKASVVRNQRAPLLLGQSVLGRLGKIEIDNPGTKLKITHSFKK